MGISERKERHKETLRQEILDAAREIVLDRGYAHLSMRGIARRIEYSPTTIYLYFRNKEDILYHLCVEALERELEVVVAAVAKQSSPLLRLRSTMRGGINFALSEPDRYKIIYMADISQYVSMAKILEKGSAASKLCELMRNGVNEVLADSTCAADPETAFQALWGHCHGIVSLLIGRPEFPWVEREKLIEMSLDLSLALFLR